jgi:hypothetical protein
MKSLSPHIPSALLLGQAIYLAFVPVTIAHSIILFSLAGLFAFNQFLLSKQTPCLSTEIGKLKRELEERMEKQKESYEVRLKLLEDEVGRASLTAVRSSSSSPKQEGKKYVF